ncbi:imm11 family protein [Archangium violaceum]|uniref:imm11 family protein n=1 Tax=Archangium violaceum TaxID=83451 RepID=UPI0037C17783
MKYYDLLSNMSLPGRWVLADPVDEHGQEVDPWRFDKGCLLEPKGKLVLHQVRPGSALDFCFTTLSIPVVHGRIVSLCDRLGLQQQVQFLPAQVEGQSEPYFILNSLRIIRCIDDARCEEVRYWRSEDGDPDRVGQYRVVAGMRIDPSNVGDSHIFRPWGWSVALLVSEHLKHAMEEDRITGTKFVEV